MSPAGSDLAIGIGRRGATLSECGRMPADRTGNGTAGTLLSIHRHPVKSMIGEELDESEVTEAGILGDRDYALIDLYDGKVASAKNPKKWGRLFEYRAEYECAPRAGQEIPAVCITMPDGSRMFSTDPDAHSAISRVLGREVRLNRRERGHEGIVETTLPNLWTPKLEEYWPEEVEGLAHSGIVTDEAMPKSTFFDLAPVHVLTTATLEALGQVYPAGHFEVRRFRPNLVVESPDGQKGFVENGWIGRTVQFGDEVQLSITGPCPRCVMTTLPQQGLLKDTGILRAAAQYNGAAVGVYASVVRAGRLRRGDQVRVL